MADALLSPAVGGAFLAVSGGLLTHSARRLGRQPDERRVPLMGVLGAFVFAAQMINFSIPGTGSSGHIGGGMLLAILLGPHSAFLVVASVLVVQCLFFLDGGILALGTNMFNLGAWPCFLGLLIYRVVLGRSTESGQTRPWRPWLASLIAVVVSLELGALGVVLQTLLSGRSDLPFGRFAALMLGIHLPIALVEGIVTAAVVQYVRALRPSLFEVGERFEHAVASVSGSRDTLVPVLASFLVMTVLSAGVLSWFASPRPDGLESSLEKVQKIDQPSQSPQPSLLERVQKNLALMPDYDFRGAGGEAEKAGQTEAAEKSWPSVRLGTSVAGLLGVALTSVVICLVAAGLYLFRSHRSKAASR